MDRKSDSLGEALKRQLKNVAMGLAFLAFLAVSALANGFSHLDGRLALARLSLSHAEEESSSVVTPVSERRRQDERANWLGDRSVDISYKLRTAEIRNVTVYNRVKSIESATEKVRRKGLESIDQLNDLYGMRIVVENELDVYRSLNVICDAYETVPGTIKNYIANPKPSGYQSVHVVNNIEGRRVEFQIRTRSMHEQAEAEHAEYKKRVCVA